MWKCSVPPDDPMFSGGPQLDEGVLRWFSRRDQSQLHSTTISPLVQCVAAEHLFRKHVI